VERFDPFFATRVLEGIDIDRDSLEAISESLSQAMCVFPKRDAAEWAKEKRVLSKESSRPGKFDVALTPYLIPVYRALHENRYRKYVLILPTQSGKTEVGLNLIGQTFDEQRKPVLYVGPTQALAAAISRRIDTMFNRIPSMRGLISRAKINNSGEKIIGGVRLGMAWSSSEPGMSSHPAAIVICDEVDKFNDACGESGDPLENAESRCSSFDNYQLILYSSPSKGKIKKHFDEGTSYTWNWACPKCGRYFAPVSKMLKWSENSTPAQAERNAYLECPTCEYHILDMDKVDMNEKGIYLAPGQDVDEKGIIIGGELEETLTVSWRVNGMCSPWLSKSFGKMAGRLLKAYRSKESERIKAVITSEFAEDWEEKGDAPEISDIDTCIKPYRMTEIPEGVEMLLSGVDVQKRGLYYVIRGFGYGLESWLVDRGYIEGDTDKHRVWQELERLVVRRTIVGEDEQFFPVSMVGIDARYRTDMVYDFCNHYNGYCFPILGHESNNMTPVTRKEINRNINYKGNKTLRKFSVYHIDDGFYKKWVFSRLRWDPTVPGGWWLPEDIDDFYKKSVVSEELMIKASGRQSWRLKFRENHYLDCEKILGAMTTIGNLGAYSRSRGA